MQCVVHLGSRFAGILESRADFHPFYCLYCHDGCGKLAVEPSVVLHIAAEATGTPVM